MGNKQTKIHLENAAKSGVCTLANAKLEELPPELFKVLDSCFSEFFFSEKVGY